VPIEEFPTLHSQELKLSQAPCVYGNKHFLKVSAYKDEKELNKWIKSQVKPVARIIFEKVR